MPNGPFDPTGGLIGRFLTLRPVEVQTRVRGRHTVFISEDVGFRDLGATRGCADYMAEFSTYTTFPKGPAKPIGVEEQGEPQTAQYLDCTSTSTSWTQGQAYQGEELERMQEIRTEKESFERLLSGQMSILD